MDTKKKHQNENMLENVIILSKSTSGFIGIIYIYILLCIYAGS
jgi:hypothetical protein